MALITSDCVQVMCEAMSNAVITPGSSTTDDVSWWMWQRSVDLGSQQPSPTLPPAKAPTPTPTPTHSGTDLAVGECLSAAPPLYI